MHSLLAATPRFSEAGYRALFEHHNIVMMIFDAESGAIVDVNQAALGFYSYSYSQFTCMNIAQINTLSPDEIAAARYQVMAEKQTTFHFKHRLADGMLRDVEVHSSYISPDTAFVRSGTVPDDSRQSGKLAAFAGIPSPVRGWQ
jgi:PAS domain S-box-containing protein